MNRICLPVLLSLVMMAACDDASPAGPGRVVNVGTIAPRAGLVTVAGRVIDYATGAGVGSAIVVFRTFVDDTPVGQATADGAGAYSIDLPAGDYLVSINGVSATAVSVRQSSSRGNLIAGAAGCSALYGYVGDARGGGPLDGVRVEALGKETMTDASGWYLIDWGCGANAGFGTSVARFTKAGYEERVRVIGRGLPVGASRADVGLMRPASDE